MSGIEKEREQQEEQQAKQEQKDCYADPKDNFEGVHFLWFACLEDKLCTPIINCQFQHPYVDLVLDITGITQGPRIDGAHPTDKTLFGRTDHLREPINEGFDRQSLLQFQICTDDDFENRDTWRRLHFKGRYATPPFFHFTVDLPEDVRQQMQSQGSIVGQQTASFKLHIVDQVLMTGDWAGVPRESIHPCVPRPPAKDTAQIAADLGKKTWSFTKAVINGLGELATNVAAENKREAADRKLLKAEKGTWHSHKAYPHLYEEIQNWLCSPIANGEQFRVVSNIHNQQLQASLNFVEYVAPQYPQCSRTITLILNFVPLTEGTDVNFDWVVVQDLHAGSIHGPQMIRIVNNGIRHWCEVDTDPAL